jgi:hypothetical protein
VTTVDRWTVLTEHFLTSFSVPNYTELLHRPLGRENYKMEFYFGIPNRALSLVNIAHIATICGDTRGASHNLDQAKHILSTFMVPQYSIYCSMFEAEIEFTEEKFEIAKVKFKEIFTSYWGKDNDIELF